MADVLAAHAICHVYHGTEIAVVVVNVLFHGAKLQRNRRTANKNNVKKTKKRPQTNKGEEQIPAFIHRRPRIVYDDAVSTVQPEGTPLTPVTFHVAELFLMNLPVEATLFTQLLVYVVEGVVVNIALI